MRNSLHLSADSRIFVSGHRGLVGSSILENLQARGYKNLITRTHAELELLDTHAVDAFYAQERPEVVFVSAARVGGIYANNTYPADFIYENLQIQNNIIWGAHKAGVRRLVFLGSSCIYPRLAPQPMPESCLLSGDLEPTNRPYALAKIAGLELVNGLRRQFGRDYFSCMPTNLYGPRDNFHPENSHVLPALIRRFVDAKERGAAKVAVWGTGNPRREFLYAPDCADAIVHLAERIPEGYFESAAYPFEGLSHVNIGSGEDITIREVATIIAEVLGYKGIIEFDPSRPDGTPRKLLDVTLLNKLGWKQKTSIFHGIQHTVHYYLKQEWRKPKATVNAAETTV